MWGSSRRGAMAHMWSKERWKWPHCGFGVGQQGEGRRKWMDGAAPPETQIQEQLCLQSVGRGVAEHCCVPPPPRAAVGRYGVSAALQLCRSTPFPGHSQSTEGLWGRISPFLTVTKGC